MSLRNVAVVYRKEMLDSLRDRRTLISMIVVPVLVIPLLVLGMGFTTAKVVGKARKEVPKVMILGGEHGPELMQSLRELASITIVPPRADFTNLIANKEIRAALQIPAGFDKALTDGSAPPTLDVFTYEGELKSSFAAETLQGFLRQWRDKTVRDRIAGHNLPESLLKPFEIERQNVAPPKKVVGNLLGGLLPYVVILLCLVGAMYPAMDLTAGEKERGTMETILSSPVSRVHLVLGKFFTVLTASLATGGLSILSMGLTFLLAKSLFASITQGRSRALALSIDVSSVVMVFVMIIPVTVFFAGVLLAISLFAKSFKEAQTYLSPMMFVVVVPAMASMAPGVELNMGLSLVPILNTSLVSKEIMTGTYHWNYIALIFLSSCIYAGAALFLAVKMFQRESVIFRV